jgi:hypothetical protein
MLVLEILGSGFRPPVFCAFYQAVTACYAACYRSARPPVIPAGVLLLSGRRRKPCRIDCSKRPPARAASRGFRVAMSGIFLRSRPHETQCTIRLWLFYERYNYY